MRAAIHPAPPCDANSNRCANASSCGSPTFSYNPGDQLTSSPYGSGYVYDTYGNLDAYAKTGGGTVNFDYDSYDHTIRICEHLPH